MTRRDPRVSVSSYFPSSSPFRPLCSVAVAGFLEDTLPLEERAVAAFASAGFARVPSFVPTMKRRATALGITYEDEKARPFFMNFGLLPVVIPLRVLRYLRFCAAEIMDGIRRLLPVWMEDAALQNLLPLWPEEEEFVRATWTPEHVAVQPAVARLDASVGCGDPSLLARAGFYEVNTSCVGGMHYSPAGETFIEREILPRLPAGIRARLRRQEDLRDIILRHLEAHRRRPGALVLLEDRDTHGGITEYPSMAAYFRSRGVEALMADPREVERRGDDLFVRGRRAGIFYRNVEARDLVRMERRVGVLRPVRHAFRRNLVVSSTIGEFDHKSVWEALRHPSFQKLFTTRQRSLFRSHLPWTRLVEERRTSFPDGTEGDLLRYARRRQEGLVLKPNRSCGGTGVTIGSEVSRARWESTLERAVADTKEGWVVQEYVLGFRKRLPILHREQGVVLEPVFVNYGVLTCREGYGLIGRVCREPIVNVSRGGAQMAMFHES